MDLAKLKNNEKLDLCVWYFRAGLFCLPFVWLVNAIWFYKEAFKKPPYEEQNSIKKYVLLSGAGAVIWAVAVGTWVYIYQTRRVAWGQFGDSISFVTPTGEP